MATDLGNLDRQLEEELGGGELAPDALRRMNLLLMAVLDFNAAASLSFTVVGTTLDRTASDIEARAIVLCAAVKYLRGLAITSAGMAIRHSNVAGSTDLRDTSRAYEARIKELDAALAMTLERLTDRAVAGEVVAAELGETLSIQPLTWTSVDGRW
jgi:hypothetical protein